MLQEYFSSTATKKEEKTWEHFLVYLKSNSLALLANLEQGNIILGPEKKSDRTLFKIGFPTHSKIIFDLLSEKNELDKLKRKLSEFFECDFDSIELNLVQIDSEKDDQNFKSKFEIERLDHEKIMETKRVELLKNPHILEAEKLFNAKIDKIFIKENK